LLRGDDVAKKVAKAASKKMAAGKSSKTKKASKKVNSDIAMLLQIVSAAPVLTFKQRKSAAKLFELAVLAEMLFEYQAYGGHVELRHAPGVSPTFPGSPASLNRAKFAWFELRDSSTAVAYAEAWVSVQFNGLSGARAVESAAASGLPPPPDLRSSRHELDLMLLRPGVTVPYPLRTDIIAAVSAKHVSTLTKEAVREALGFRREMGLLQSDTPSECPWLEPNVPSEPPSPLYLVSSAAKFDKYAGHIQQLGIYPRFMKFPY
jgi:hypothetical protein